MNRQIANPQLCMDGKPDSYALYTARFDVGAAAEGRWFLLNRLRGTVSLYADGQLLAEKSCPNDECVRVPIPRELCGKCKLSAIIRNTSYDQRAGFLEPITMIREENHL